MTKTNLSLFLVLELSLMLAASGCAGIQTGKDNYNHWVYETTLKERQSLAEQGDAEAQNKLGLIYDQGLGVAQDYVQAVRWYRLAADQGHAPAQLNLGNLYREGKGVSQDREKAVQWFRLAADQGFAPAQNNLGYMFFKGKCVTQNYILAYMWTSLAAAQGTEMAVMGLEMLEKDMTPAQIAEAQRLAREWKAKEEMSREAHK